MFPAAIVVLALAAPWYVDGDARCPGDGSDTAPFCAVQGAFDNEALAAGDEILVRAAAVPYAGARIGDVSPRVSGTAEAPITLRADDGHSPIIAGEISIQHCAYWTIRGLVFHGEGDASPTNAIDIFTDGVVGEVHGIVVEDNTILGFGGAPELDEGAYGSTGVINIGSWTPDDTPMLIGPIIRNNRVRASRGAGIHLIRTRGAVVEGNEIADLGCQLDTSYLDEETMEFYTRAAVVGLRVRRSPDARIVRNRIDDLDHATCAPFDVDSDGVYGIWADGALEVEIDHNLVRGIGAQPGEGMGIATTGSSHDARVHHNIVIDADRCGICNGIEAPGGADRLRYVNNTIVGGAEHGIDLMQGDGAFIGNNLITGSDDAAIRILAVEGYVTNWSADDNLYWDEGAGDGIGQIGWTVETDLATWQSDCSCDASSVVGDPMLPGSAALEDFTVATASPAVDAGGEYPEVAGYNGLAPDVGALEAPVAIAASMAANEPTVVRLLVEHSAEGALVIDPGCLGLAVEVDGEAMALVGCSTSGPSEIVVELAEPVWAGQSVVLAHAGSTITDTARIGGLISAFLRPFDLAVDNAVRGDPPDDTGTTTDAPPSTDTSSTTSDVADTSGTGPELDAGAGYPDAGACECSNRASGSATWAWLLLLMHRRRRRAIRSPSRGPQRGS